MSGGEGYSAHLPEKNHKAKNKREDFFQSILEKASDITEHLDHQINILIGLSSAVFVFTASGFEKDSNAVPLLIMATFSAATALVGLFAVHPPKSMRKRGQPESLLYNKTIAEFSSAKDYQSALMAISKDEKSIAEQYAREVYNLCKYYYRPKRQLFHIARKIFFYGIALSLAAFIYKLIPVI